LPDFVVVKMFERESELLGEDFNKVLDEVGGKNAGNRLLKVIYDNWARRIEDVRSNAFKSIRLNDSFEVPTSFYRDFESIVMESGSTFLKKHVNITSSIPEVDLFKEKNADYVSNFLDFLKKNSSVIPKRKSLSFGGKKIEFREAFVRSSSTSEDFRRPELAGTANSFKVSDLEFIDVYLISFFDFFNEKFGENRFGYSDDESLAFQVAKFLNPRQNIMLTGTCELVNNQYIVNIEVVKGISDKSIRYRVSEDNQIEIFYGFPKKTRFPYEIEGLPSLLSEEQVRAISDLLRLKKEILGYDIDAEYILTRNKDLVSVQLRRISPILNEEAELDYSGEIIAETPFVMRKKFVAEGYLLSLSPEDVRNAQAYGAVEAGIRDESILLVDKDETGTGFHKDILEKPYAGMVFSNGIVEITHSSITGLTYLLRNSGNNIVAIPNIEKIIKLSDFQHNDVRLKRSKDKYRLVSDGKTATLFRI